MTSPRFAAVFRESPFPLLGMVHLGPLPGSPRWRGSMSEVVEAAGADARVLVEAGFEGVMVENFGDVPFYPDQVPEETVAAMAVCCLEVRRVLGAGPLLGVNVLRNDAAAALGVATAVGADLIRVNVHGGAMWTDQGLVQGRAHLTLRRRHSLGVEVAVLADVLVKHAHPPAPAEVGEVVRETAERGLADGIIVSGVGTGAPVDLELLDRARAAVSDRPLLVGSGTTLELLPQLMDRASGAIVGSWLKREGRVEAAVDPERAQRLVERRNRLRSA